jgi:LysR family nitrogen assimilation transcriptional regulator
METRYLKAFLKIADTGSISRAAESLGIAQPSLSQQLLRLEDEVGTALFRRTARGVTLTEAGRVFQEHARQILCGTEQAVEDLRGLSGEATGEVIVAVPWTISQIAAVTLVEAFRRHAPLVRLRLVEALTGQIRGWLDSGKIDLGVLHDLGPIRHLSTRPLAVEELFLAGPAGRYGTAEDPVTIEPAHLAGMPLVLPGQPHGLRQVIEHECSALHLMPSVALELDAIGHIGALVARGECATIAPLPVLAGELAVGTISLARIGENGMHRRLCLARNAGQVVTHASVRAEELFTRVLARLIEKGEWRAVAAEGLR